jgi:tetratricopeptide (TPR) repeat protein
MEVTDQLRGTNPVDAGRSYALLGGVLADLGETDRAREVLELAIDLLEQEAPTRYLVQAYKRLATLLKEQGDKDAALEVLERALGIQEQAGRPLS